MCRAVQRPGEYMITFPRSYHAGFSCGYCLGEAVNFATRDWVPFGADCVARYRRVRKAPILPHDELVVGEGRALISARPAVEIVRVTLAGTAAWLGVGWLQGLAPASQCQRCTSDAVAAKGRQLLGAGLLWASWCQ